LNNDGRHGPSSVPQLWEWLGAEHLLTDEQTGELVATYLSLHLLARSPVCEDVICEDLASPHAQTRARACARFAAMWRISGTYATAMVG
jgi:hypothetical protein